MKGPWRKTEPEPAPSTIGDADWHDLQKRTQRVTPPLGSPERTARLTRAADNFDKREQN